MAITSKRECIGGAGCTVVQLYQTTIQGVQSQSPRMFPGKGWLSRNGRYLLTGSPNQDSCEAWTLFDLHGTAEWPLGTQSCRGGSLTASGRAVADDGTVVFAAGELYVMRQGQFSRLQSSQQVTAAEPVIDAEGQNAVYTALPSPTQTHAQLRVYRLATSQDGVLFEGNGDSYAPAISADGTKVTFLTTVPFGNATSPGPAQLYRINLDGSGLEQFPNAYEPDGVKTYALSDDGTVAWYVSSDGRLFKVNLDADESEERIARTPQSVLFPPQISRGSAMTLTTSAITPGHTNIQMDGLAAPILSTTEAAIAVQAPWEIHGGNDQRPLPYGPTVNIAVETGMTSPFNTTFRGSTEVLDYLPNLESPPIHQDWSGFVTSENPAQSQETIYFYATGLGPVTPAIASGVPGPGNPPAVAVTSPSCNATLLYAGLAPGLIGYYQISVQLPDSISKSPFVLSCNVDGFGFTSEIPVK